MPETLQSQPLIKSRSGFIFTDGEYMTPQAVDFINLTLSGSKFDWRTTTPTSLRGHIVRDHMRPATLASYGVARYDIELAAHLGIPLDWVVRKTYGRLAETEAAVMLRMYGDLTHLKNARPESLYPYWDIPSYKAMLVRNLIYIERLRLADINWIIVGMATKDLPQVDLDLARDAHDTPFSPDRLF